MGGINFICFAKNEQTSMSHEKCENCGDRLTSRIQKMINRAENISKRDKESISYKLTVGGQEMELQDFLDQMGNLSPAATINIEHQCAKIEKMIAMRELALSPHRIVKPAIHSPRHSAVVAHKAAAKQVQEEEIPEEDQESDTDSDEDEQ